MSKKPTKPDADEADKTAKPVPQPGTGDAAATTPAATPTPPEGNGVARRFIQRHRRTLKGLSNK